MEWKTKLKTYNVPDHIVTDDSRYWEFIVYEDSAPKDWLYQLDMTGLKIAISPYHDHDLIEGTDQPKKPHWHVLCIWQNKTTFKHALSFSDMLNCPFPLRKDNLQGAYDYHTHKNHADKYQYDDQDRKHLNGLTKSDIKTLSVIDVRKITNEILRFINLMCIYEYSTLLDTLIEKEMFEHFDYAISHTLLFDKYITSRRHKDKKKIFTQDE